MLRAILVSVAFKITSYTRFAVALKENQLHAIIPSLLLTTLLALVLSMTFPTGLLTMKQVRIACLDAIKQSGCDFVEAPVPVEATNELSVINPDTAIGKMPSVATIRTESGLSIELSDTISAEFIQKLLGSIAYVK